MRNETINKIVVLFSFLISLSSAMIALLSGGDIFSVIVVRFLAVFAMSALVIWTALAIINSTIVTAASKAVDEFREELIQEDKEKLAQSLADSIGSEMTKGQLLDLVSAEDNIDLASIASSTQEPEITEFEPFKPKRIESDIAE